VAREDAVGLEAALSAIARGQLASPETSVEWLSAHTRETLAKRTWTLVEQMLPPRFEAMTIRDQWWHWRLRSSWEKAQSLPRYEL
jgi:hypothetical protein